MSVPADLAAMLRARWADDAEDLARVRVIATERELDDIRTRTVVLRQTGIRRAPEAQGLWEVSVALAAVSGMQDLDRAADELDSLVQDVLDALTDLGIAHDGATSVAYGNRLAYDIPLTVYAPRKAPTE